MITLPSPARIHVVGTSGCGKSTLARELAMRFDLTDIELDALHWEANWKAAEPEVFRERLKTAMQLKPGWVVHGNYASVREMVWKDANVIIWLDYPLWFVLTRVVRRTVRRLIAREELWNGNRESFRMTFMSRDSIILWSIKTFAKRRRQYTEWLAGLDPKQYTVLRFRHPSEAERFLQAQPILAGSARAPITSQTKKT